MMTNDGGPGHQHRLHPGRMFAGRPGAVRVTGGAVLVTPLLGAVGHMLRQRGLFLERPDARPERRLQVR